VRLPDFWASWCDPCRESLPELRQLRAIYGGGGFELISFNEDENEAAGHRLVAQNGMNWKQHFDPKHTFMWQ
jgi:thioredoxin-like negative regulator of GroEL